MEDVQVQNVMQDIATSVAQQFFQHRRADYMMEEQLGDLLVESIGLTSMDTDNWPFDDITFDGYDSSFEFKNVKLEWKTTEDMQRKWWAMGFLKCYICYENGSEAIFYKPGAPR